MSEKQDYCTITFSYFMLCFWLIRKKNSTIYLTVVTMNYRAMQVVKYSRTTMRILMKVRKEWERQDRIFEKSAGWLAGWLAAGRTTRPSA
jgi:hypothetical protein